MGSGGVRSQSLLLLRFLNARRYKYLLKIEADLGHLHLGLGNFVIRTRETALLQAVEGSLPLVSDSRLSPYQSFYHG